VLVQAAAGNILIDTTPEMRLQLLRESIGCVGAVLFTHYHADHLFGLDDVRIFPRWLGHALPVYCEPRVERIIRQAFAYAFDARVQGIPAGGVPKLAIRSIAAGHPFEVFGERCIPIRLLHGPFRVLGFRFRDVAYCTDVSRIPARSWRLLEGLDVLVLDALRHRPHPTHFSIEESLRVVERLKPNRTFFTHIAHDLDHAATNAALPPTVQLAFDGLRVDFD
jgi:phosphoribosyl 1,2-cyclic phosphate phosphodiesterase